MRQRCKTWEVPPEQVGAFLNGGWLQGKLPTERNRMGTRQFLQLCSARWEESGTWWNAQDRAVAPEGRGRPRRWRGCWTVTRTTSRASPSGWGSTRTCFRWLVEDVARDRPGWKVSANTKSVRDDLLPVMWTPPGEAEGVHRLRGGRQLETLARDPQRGAGVLRDAAGSPPRPDRAGTVTGKAVLFRTAEQARIPGARWSVAAESQRRRKRSST